MHGALPAPILINNANALATFERELRGHAAIAVDTEADSYYSYREKVCLIQISTESDDYLIDPLAPMDLSALAPVFADQGVRKVFHDAEYDVQLLKAAGFTEMKQIFDTRLGVSLLGVKTPGLANVLRDRFGIHIDKSQQKSDWRRRPLLPEQLEYARHDTRYLLRLAREVEADLAARDRMEIFTFECERLAASQPRERVYDSYDCLSMRGAETLDPHGLSALRELALAREGVASQADVAPFRIIANELLIILAQLRPRDWRELDAVRAVPNKLKETFGGPALAAIERAREQGPWYPERRKPAFTEEQLYYLDRLKKWRTRKAEQFQMDSSSIMNRHTLEFLAKNPPHSLEELQKAPGLAPWQYKNFSMELMQLFIG